MNNKRSFISAIVDSLKDQSLFEKSEYKTVSSGELVIFSELDRVLYTIQTRFQLSDVGMAPREISCWLKVDTIEKVIESIATNNGLRYDPNFEHTLTNSVKDKNLYKDLTSGTLGIPLFREKFEDYSSIEIIPFFESRGTIEGLGEYVLQHPFDNIINIGLGGEYPVNVLKAITIAKWCGNEAKYEEYTKGLQTWIDEDRNDPNYAKLCDAYQGALDELKSKLESQT